MFSLAAKGLQDVEHPQVNSNIIQLAGWLKLTCYLLRTSQILTSYWAFGERQE